MPTASNSAGKAYDEICRAKLDTLLERTDNNYCLQTPETGGEIIPESGGAIISEQWGGFIGIGSLSSFDDGQLTKRICDTPAFDRISSINMLMRYVIVEAI